MSSALSLEQTTRTTKAEEAVYGSADSSSTSVRGHGPKIILLMGARSSGKTSLVDFVFKKMHPTNSLYTDPTRKPTPTDFTAFIDFQIWDLPGGLFEVDTLELPLAQICSIIYVVDAQAYSGDTADIQHKIAFSYAKIRAINPRIYFDVFLHKTDSLSEEYRSELTENARERIEDEMIDIGDEHWGAPGKPPPHLPDMSFHLTSVFDHSVYQALSKILMRLLPCQAALEQLLDLVTASSGMEKAFLFHLSTKLYIGTDSSPVDARTHEICSDFIDLCLDFGALYEPSLNPSSATPSRQPSPMRPSRAPSNALSSSTSSLLPNGHPNAPKWRSSRVKLASGVSMAHWQIDDRLSLIALLRKHVIDQSSALIEYNVAQFRESIAEIHSIES